MYSAMGDKRTPWYAKAMLGLVLAYIISPIDLIPDFIPVIGLLDEVILVPIALALIFKFIPSDIKQEHSLCKIDEEDKKKLMIIGVFLVMLVWTFCLLIFFSLHPF